MHDEGLLLAWVLHDLEKTEPATDVVDEVFVDAVLDLLAVQDAFAHVIHVYAPPQIVLQLVYGRDLPVVALRNPDYPAIDRYEFVLDIDAREVAGALALKSFSRAHFLQRHVELIQLQYLLLLRTLALFELNRQANLLHLLILKPLNQLIHEVAYPTWACPIEALDLLQHFLTLLDQLELKRLFED